MNKKRLFHAMVRIAVAVAASAGLAFSQTKVLWETDQVVANPGKGWVIYGPDVSSYLQEEWLRICVEEPYRYIPDEVWGIGSLVYMRYHWTDIEPEEGKFNWEVLDVPIRLAAERGKQFAFGVMSCNSCIGSQATPQYVFDAGAEIVRVIGWDNIQNRETELNTPYFHDPVYHAKMAQFLQALGARYDGHPAIAFFDIRSYGNWGENHVLGLGDMIPKITSDEFKNVHVRMHQDAFKKTKLVTAPSHKPRAFAAGDDAEVWQWCVDQGVGLRWDGYLYHKTDMVKWSEIALEASIGRDYGILECFQPYGNHPNYTNYNAWEEAIARTQSSYCSLANWGPNGALFYKEHREFVNRLTNLLGYHFVVSTASYSASLQEGGSGSLFFSVENKGAAPMLIDASVQVALLDRRGRVLERRPLENVNPQDWRPGDKADVDVALQFQAHPDAGQLAVGLFSAHAGETPDIRFGNKEVNGTGWLLVGE